MLSESALVYAGAYVLLIAILSISAIFYDYKKGISILRLSQDTFAGIAKISFVINAFTAFFNPVLLIVTIVCAGLFDILSFARDYDQLKKAGLGMVIFSYTFSTLIILPAYVLAVLSLFPALTLSSG